MARSIKISYINHDSAGFSDDVQVPAGTTIQEFFNQKMPGRDSRSYLIHVNSLPPVRDYVLTEGDCVSISPTKVQGARLLI